MEKKIDRSDYRRLLPNYIQEIFHENSNRNSQIQFLEIPENRQRLRKSFLFSLPTIFNYGFIEGTTGPDGMEEDVVCWDPASQREYA